ncbi:hypothetical protein ACIA98_17225 [Streptomyces sp. NPDC051366]
MAHQRSFAERLDFLGLDVRTAAAAESGRRRYDSRYRSTARMRRL